MKKLCNTEDFSDIPADSRAANSKMNNFIKGLLNESTIGKVQKIRTIADKLGVPMAQVALAWVLRQPNVASALIGASRPEQVIENAKASGYVLSDEILTEIQEAFTISIVSGARDLAQLMLQLLQRQKRSTP